MIGERMTGIMDYIDIARQIIEERLYGILSLIHI